MERILSCSFCLRGQMRASELLKRKYLLKEPFAPEAKKICNYQLHFADMSRESKIKTHYMYFRKECFHEFSSLSSFKFSCMLKKTIWGNAVSQSKHCLSSSRQNGEDSESEDSERLRYEEEALQSHYENWSREIIGKDEGHSVLVVQPYIKWGEKKKTNTSPDLQLDEAVALVDSLRGWRVVERASVGLRSFDKRSLFGSGNFEMFRQKLQNDKRISAVFINVKMLRGIQHREMENAFGVPVFDRYLIVIKIFQQHAVTREAKLQVAMAEIPYLRSRLRGMHEGELEQDRMQLVGGVKDMLYETRKHILMEYEKKLKDDLHKLRSHRKMIRSKRHELEYPIVAVVGYTNTGKTSIIKALTGDANMQPENRLFATLDVTNHMGLLPCGLEVLYVDTVGFISDIPSDLIESFVATLEDAMFADVILQVQDESHPDKVAQAENVMDTLQQFNLPVSVLENTVIARNKADLIPKDQYNEETDEDKEGILVSAVTKKGLSTLLKKIEKAVLRATGRKSLIVRVPMGGEEARWLYREVAVTATKADERNNQYLLMRVVMTDIQLNRFKHYFTKAV